MSTGKGGEDVFAQHAVAVARELLGDPNKALSKPDNLRWGNQGSLSLDVEKGAFFDHSEGIGFGVLAFIEHQTGETVAGGKAVEWLREHGFYVPDGRDKPSANGYAGNGSARPKDRFDAKGNWLPGDVPDNAELTAAYPYVDADGKLVYEAIRFDWPDADEPKGHKKKFLQRQPSGAGRYKWNLRGIAPLLYRLPELIEDIAAGEQVFVVEGEKKVDMLRALGIPATCNSGGAGNFKESLAQWLTGAKVVLVPDNDDAGREHVTKVGNALEGLALSIKVLPLPGVPEKGSIDDWLPAGGTPEKLYDLASKAEAFEPSEYKSRFGAVTWEHLDDAGPTHEDLIKGVLTRGELSLLLGESQSGKSFVAIDISMCVARGIPWNNKKVRGGAVIYQAGESAVGVRRLRLPAYRQHYNVAQERLPFVLLQNPLDLYKSDEDTDALIEECLHWARRAPVPLELIVIDTFNKATPGANENDGKDMGTVLARCDRIRRQTGAHVMLVHHLNAGGTKARGHTSLYANVENVLLCHIKPDSHDADGRKLREVVLAKQKDGEDGATFPFVLAGISIGVDADNDPKMGAIVVPPAGVAGAPLPNDGAVVNGPAASVLKVIYDVLAKEGIFAPVEMNLPSGTYVVTRRQIADELVKVRLLRDEEEDISPDDEAAIERRANSRRVAWSRAKNLLFTKGIIGLNGDHVWLIGRPVKGFPAPPGSRPKRRPRMVADKDGGAPFAPDEVTDEAVQASADKIDDMGPF